jgi:hypothetical protein
MNILVSEGMHLKLFNCFKLVNNSFENVLVCFLVSTKKFSSFKAMLAIVNANWVTGKCERNISMALIISDEDEIKYPIRIPAKPKAFEKVRNTIKLLYLLTNCMVDFCLKSGRNSIYASSITTNELFRSATFIISSSAFS